MSNNTIVDYIEKLVNVPSPTGFTEKITNFLLKNAEEKEIENFQTKKGAVVYKFPANTETKKSKSVMFAVHVDTLGAMVKEVRKDCLKLSIIGGYPAFYVIGDYCKIHTYENNEIEGTILPDNPAVHVNNKLKDLKPNFKNIHVRVDYDLDKKLKDEIKVGNFVSLDPKFSHINGYVKSRHLDDKASAAILLNLADWLNDNRINLKDDVYMFFNVTEETGQGLSVFSQLDELIIVDMGVVGEGVAGSEEKVSICAKDSSGPYNYQITRKLTQIAEKNKINHVVDVFPYYASDGSAALRAGNDLKVALLGPGVGASHGYERCHEKSLKATTDLLKRYIVDEK